MASFHRCIEMTFPYLKGKDAESEEAARAREQQQPLALYA